MTKPNIPKPGTKLDALRKALGKGATLDQLSRELNWQPHTIRAAMTRLRQRGFIVTRERQGTGVSIFKIERSGGNK